MSLYIFKSMVLTSLKDKISLFYALVFPLLLMSGLGYYFETPEMRLSILSGVTAVSTIFWGMQGIAFQVFSHRNKGVYKFLKLTPMPVLVFVAIMVLARAVIGIILNLFVWITGVLLFGIDISLLSLGSTFLLIIFGTTCFTSIGFLIANLANNEGQINMYSNLLQLPMIFMSEAFYSLANAPEWIGLLGKALPFDPFVKGLRNLLNGNPETIGEAILILCVYTAGAIFLAVPTFRWDEKQERTRKIKSMNS
ncbi:hypothetical protein A8F94_20515 [Bacillus sp. FJAT-27225]|uniref:ABC transporter permease n=1 Tax=Bacillus sp. FJAT-27225 TaxID=1743144 RepID=UPI00080C22F7|nr:ABC transporter permease [Bacillus sp. FJAT-27225]OCA82297.1 hypothetical protein A8F94_20515 [Bacillus sp. FJAT-27225]